MTYKTQNLILYSVAFQPVFPSGQVSPAPSRGSLPGSGKMEAVMPSPPNTKTAVAKHRVWMGWRTNRVLQCRVAPNRRRAKLLAVVAPRADHQGRSSSTGCSKPGCASASPRHLHVPPHLFRALRLGGGASLRRRKRHDCNYPQAGSPPSCPDEAHRERAVRHGIKQGRERKTVAMQPGQPLQRDASPVGAHHHFQRP